MHAGEHVSVDRDPGVYLVAGQWVATRGDLRIEAGASEWTSIPGLVYASPGFYDLGEGTLEAQFNHFATVLYAEAYGVGGEALMIVLPAILGGLALCAIYAALTRLVSRPWLAVAAVAALAISLPQLHIVRDTFSEPSTQLLLWAGLWGHSHRVRAPFNLTGPGRRGSLRRHCHDADRRARLCRPLPLVAAVAWLAEIPTGGDG